MAPATKPSRSPLRGNLSVPFFWGETYSISNKPTFPIHAGYTEARDLIKTGNLQILDSLTTTAQTYITRVFTDITLPTPPPSPTFATLQISPSLQNWIATQKEAGLILPSKGYGISPASPEVLKLMGATNFPPPIQTNGALFGSGIANMLIGGHDPRTIYSNYCTDMAFYHEHGYSAAFPSFWPLVTEAAADPHALNTPAGRERREAVKLGIRYIKNKVELERSYKDRLHGVTAKMDRKTAQILFLSESSLVGLASEAMARGFDPAAVMSDMVWSNPGTDVVDVGSDFQNSEVMNSFLNTADITESGLITEKSLRRVYDAYACLSGRMFTKRWAEPAVRMGSTLYTWHILNNRHGFCRRALLGWGMVREGPFVQREGDFDEVFDEEFRTTCYSRVIEDACDGRETCDAVEILINGHVAGDLLAELWVSMVTNVLYYVSKGVVSEEREDEIAEIIKLTIAKTYSGGLIDELAWITSHATHHAWQINHLFEAAMFGSLLDDGSLKGKLDRKE